MNAGQTKFLPDDYSKEALWRELQAIHKRLNDLGIKPNLASLKTTYAAADLQTAGVADAAKIATALNATNLALNSILSKLNLTA